MVLFFTLLPYCVETSGPLLFLGSIIALAHGNTGLTFTFQEKVDKSIEITKYEIQIGIMKKNILVFLLPFTLLGCVNAARNTEELHSTRERDMTVGIVQREIRVGMLSSDVAEQLGSPNIVQRGDNNGETWIYDKIATEASYSQSEGSVGGALGAGGIPGAVLLLGGVGGDYSKNTGAYALTQKTLTVVIRFDSRNRVESFTYHSSKF